MTTSRRICMAISGIFFIIIGIVCLCKPIATIISLAWAFGLFTLISGIAALVNWIDLRKYVQQSGGYLISAILQIIIGIIFLRNKLALATLIPILFSFFIIFEGISVAIRSFDYKKVGYSAWWANLILGILAAVAGFASLNTPATAAGAVSFLTGMGFIFAGICYIAGVCAISRFKKRLKENPWIDEQ